MAATNGLAVASIGFVQTGDRVLDLSLYTSLISLDLRSVGPTPGNGSPIRLALGGNRAWADKDTLLVSGNQIRSITSVGLPPGNYEVFAYDLQVSHSIWQYSLSKEYPQPIRFTVRPGEVTYIGSYQMEVSIGRNVLGRATPERASLVVVDRAQQDLARLQRVRPETAALTFTSALGAVPPH